MHQVRGSYSSAAADFGWVRSSRRENSIAERLSSRHTVTGGHRALDIFRVSTAIHLKAQLLLTFDKNQIALTKAAGLEIRP